MKKILIVVIIAGTLTACNSNSKSKAEKVREDVKEVVDTAVKKIDKWLDTAKKNVGEWKDTAVKNIEKWKDTAAKRIKKVKSNL